MKNITVTAVAQAGLIRYAKGSECYFPAGYHFLREDVVRIKDAFERHDVPEREYSKPGTLIALRHALKNYLGRYVGLPAVIRAVLAGDLVPVATPIGFPGSPGISSHPSYSVSIGQCQASKCPQKAFSIMERRQPSWA